MAVQQGRQNVLDNYVTVAERIAAFYQSYPTGRICTQILEHNEESGFILMRAEVFRSTDDAQPSATGHAFEVRGDGYVNRTSYIENAECVPLSAEILTRRGFMPFFDLSVGEDVLAYDLESNRCTWTPLLRVTTYEEAETIRIFNQHGFDYVCTPDHSWAVSASKWQRRVPLLRKATELRASDFVILASPAPSGNSPITPSEAAILGWIFTDGCLIRSGNQVRAQIGQTKEPYVSEIRELVGTVASEHYGRPRVRTFPTGRTYETRPSYKWQIRASFLRPLLAKAGIHDARDLPDLVLRLSSDARGAMLRAMLHAEATSEYEFCQKEGPVFEAFQILATLEGFALGKLRRDSNNVVNVQKLKTRRRACASQFVTETAGRQPVWCPTTRFGTWVMRQNGNVVITGNTSAVGRALALLGFEVRRGIASREEMEKAARMPAERAARAPESGPPEGKPAAKPAPQPAAAESPATEESPNLDDDIIRNAQQLGYDAAKVRRWVNQKFGVTGGLESLTEHDKREVLKLFREQAQAAQAKSAR